MIRWGWKAPSIIPSHQCCQCHGPLGLLTHTFCGDGGTPKYDAAPSPLHAPRLAKALTDDELGMVLAIIVKAADGSAIASRDFVMLKGRQLPDRLPCHRVVPFSLEGD